MRGKGGENICHTGTLLAPKTTKQLILNNFKLISCAHYGVHLLDGSISFNHAVTASRRQTPESPMDFAPHLGGKNVNPRELSKLSNRGERLQPTTRRCERPRGFSCRADAWRLSHPAAGSASPAPGPAPAGCRFRYPYRWSPSAFWYRCGWRRPARSPSRWRGWW